MHEIGIASSILETVDAEARKRPGEKIVAVGLRIGELSSISRDALTFAFEADPRNALGESESGNRMVPTAPKVFRVWKEFIIVDYEMTCPNCGDARSACVSGTELDIAYLELEEPCARP